MYVVECVIRLRNTYVCGGVCNTYVVECVVCMYVVECVIRM